MKLKSKKSDFKLYMPCTTKKAVTLIELLIAVTIIGVIAVPLALFLDKGLNIWTEREEKSDIVNNGRVAMDWMTRELRHAVKDNINTANANEVEFKVDLDKDGDWETVKYDISDANLRRTQDSGIPYELTDRVENVDVGVDLFTYYDKNGGAPSTNDDIRYILIQLELEEDVSLETKVYLRNFKEY